MRVLRHDHLPLRRHTEPRSRQKRASDFRLFDADRDGYLNLAEFQAFVDSERGIEDRFAHITRVFKLFDADGNGSFSRTEFKAEYAAQHSDYTDEQLDTMSQIYGDGDDKVTLDIHRSETFRASKIMLDRARGNDKITFVTNTAAPWSPIKSTSMSTATSRSHRPRLPPRFLGFCPVFRPSEWLNRL